MKVTGVITEYNPFHNGHLYHIEQARKLAGADYVLAVMSGDYVQRGAPAILPKHMRARMALKAGASIVLELPVCFAAGSAEYFAAGAVSLLDRLNCVDTLCFGSECGETGILEQIAAVAAGEPPEYKKKLKALLKKGIPFPLARQEALKDCLGDIEDETLAAVLGQPNNNLGIEYIKALRQRKSRIRVQTIRREGAGYHSRTLEGGMGSHRTLSAHPASDKQGSFCSASAIRKHIFDFYNRNEEEGNTEPENENPAKRSISSLLNPLGGQIPSFCLPVFQSGYGKRFPVCSDDFSLLLKYRLMSENADSLVRFMDVTEELARRIMNHRNDFLSFRQFCSLIKTRDTAYTRISRCLLHILLNITKRDMALYKNEGFCQYARILGFREDCKPLLSHLKKCTGIPLVTKLSRAKGLTSAGQRMLAGDLLASDLYESVVTDKFGTPFVNEYKKQLVKI